MMCIRSISSSCVCAIRQLVWCCSIKQNQTAGVFTSPSTRERFNWFVLFSARCLFAQMYKAITRINTTPIAILKIVITTTIHSIHVSLRVDQNPSISYSQTHSPPSCIPPYSTGFLFSMHHHSNPHILIVTVSFDVLPTSCLTQYIWSSLPIIHGTFLYIKQSRNHVHHILILFMPFHTTMLNDVLIE